MSHHLIKLLLVIKLLFKAPFVWVVPNTKFLPKHEEKKKFISHLSSSPQKVNTQYSWRLMASKVKCKMCLSGGLCSETTWMILLGLCMYWLVLRQPCVREVNHMKVLCTDIKVFPDLLELVQFCIICFHST